MANEFSTQYLRFNEQSTKNISLVVEIPGIDLLSNRKIYTKVRYGDAGIDYGDAGIIYGGLRLKEGVRDNLSLEGSSLTISQRLEPEQGRGAISTLSLAFVDLDGYMTQVVSPGVLIPEILGADVKVYIGYEEISFKEDYTVIFRGKVSGVQAQSGRIILQISDPNLQRRQQIFFSAKSKLTIPINPSATTVPVLDNTDFFKPILGPDGLYDVPNPWNQDGTYNVLAPRQSGIRTFLKIGDEYIEYGPLGFGTNTFTGVKRGARNTVADDHVVGDAVEACIEITDHAIDLALKLMLSGFAGFWKEDVAVHSIMRTFDGALGDQPRAVILPSQVDAIKDYGLSDGDYITVSGSGVPGNNGSFRIVRFADLFDEPNRIIYLNADLAPEFPTSAVMKFRSQFDTYPVNCGVALTPEDVDVESHLNLKGDFLGEAENSYRFFLSGPETCKSFIETEIYLPVSAYSLTRRGKLSVGYTKPPLADEDLVFLNDSNILDVEHIMPTRSFNDRKYYTEVDWDYDYADDGKATSLFRQPDFEALALMKISSVLPIKSRGARTDLGTPSLFEKRSSFLLSRYRRAAVIIDCKVNWETACRIEPGSIVALQDDGNLKISNFSTGERDLGTQLFEIVDRNLDIKQGNASLKLISGVATDVSDRYATISPSSLLGVGSTTSYIIIKDSFNAKFPGDESRKWKDYMNQEVVLHNSDYSVVIEGIRLLRIDLTNNYKIFVDGLSSAPAADLIMDIPDYPDTERKIDNSLYKQIHAFLSPRVSVVTGITPTQFTVGVSDASKFFVGARVIVHNEDYSDKSDEVKVTDVSGVTITVDKTLGFTPDSTHFVSGIGFKDHGGFYRYI